MKKTLAANRILSRRAVLAAGVVMVAAKPAYAISSIPRMSGYVGDYFPFDHPPNMPAIGFTGGGNEAHNLGEFVGRVVLLNFWATWCAPCLAELPDLDRLQSRFARDQFVVLPLCEDAQTVTVIDRYYARQRIEMLGRFMDPMGRGLKAYAVPAVPTSFILDRTGRLRGILPGAAPWDSPEAQALVAYYLNEPHNGGA